MSPSFVVEEAGCESCAALVREALEPFGEVESIEVDGVADTSTVRLTAAVTEADVNDALERVSRDVGHTYRVLPGSWAAA